MSNDFSEEQWDSEGGFVTIEDTPRETPEPELPPTEEVVEHQEATQSDSQVRVKYTQPGVYQAENGKNFPYNRWVGVTEAEAAHLLSLKRAGRNIFVQATG